jgi:exosortase family protein XrtM
MTKRLIVLRVALFAVSFFLLQFVWDAMRDTSVEYGVIHYTVVQPAVWLINLLTPDARAVAVKFSVLSAGGGLNILNGCEGMDVVLLLLAAFAITPLRFTSRMLGMLGGVVVVFIINQARILLLFYSYRSDQHWFDLLHSMITPIVVTLLVGWYFHCWLLHAQRHAASV